MVVDIPRGLINEPVKYAKGANGLIKATFSVVCQLDQSCSGSLDNPGLAQAGLRIAVI